MRIKLIIIILFLPLLYIYGNGEKDQAEENINRIISENNQKILPGLGMTVEAFRDLSSEQMIEKFKGLSWENKIESYILVFKYAPLDHRATVFSEIIAEEGKIILKPIINRIDNILFETSNLGWDVGEVNLLVWILFGLHENEEITNEDKQLIINTLESKCIEYLNLYKQIHPFVDDCNKLINRLEGLETVHMNWIEQYRLLYQKYTDMGIEGIEYPEDQ